MSDGRAFHLPDLPISDHPSTHREKVLHDEICDFMRSAERNRLRLLTIVLEGEIKWRKVAQEVWRGLRIGESAELLNSILRYFELQAVKPSVQRQLLDNKNNPAKWKELVDAERPRLESEREGLRLLQKWAP